MISDAFIHLCLDLHDTAIISMDAEEGEGEEVTLEKEDRVVTASQSYQTLTEGFFMTHYCLKIGLNVILGK